MGLFQKLLFQPKARIKPGLQLRFLDRLSRSLSQGYSLVDSLETLKWDTMLHPIAVRIIEHLREGTSLPNALEMTHFHPIITSFLTISVEYGDLETSILQTKELYEKRIQYRKKFIQVIRYPVILILVFSMVFILVQHAVLPNLLQLIEPSSKNALLLQSLITLSKSIYYVFFLIVGFVIVFRWLWPSIQRRLTITQQLTLYQRIPIYRNFLQIQTSYLFATHFSSLLQTGISIKDVFHILKTQPKQPIIRHYAFILTNELNQGIHLSLLLKDLKLIHPQLAAIFQKNSNANSLQRDLAIYASFLTDELHQKIMKAITYIQPIVFGLLGVTIIIVYLLIMWPMYEIMETI